MSALIYFHVYITLHSINCIDSGMKQVESIKQVDAVFIISAEFCSSSSSERQVWADCTPLAGDGGR